MGMLDEEKSGSKKEKAPRSVAEAKKQGKSTYTGKDGKQKAAVYKEDLGKGQSLRDYLNKGGGNNNPSNNNNNKSSDNKRQAIPGKQIRSGPAGSMDSVINPRLNRQGKIVSAEDAKYLNPRDWVDGGGPGRAGPELQTKKQAIKGDREFGTIGSKLGMTPLGSGEQPSGLAKFITAGGIPGQIIRGIGGVAQDIGGAFKPATYTKFRRMIICLRLPLQIT
jgi:hypothetical protein